MEELWPLVAEVQRGRKILNQTTDTTSVKLNYIRYGLSNCSNKQRFHVIVSH